MIEKFIAIYVFIDDIMIEIGHKEPVNRNSSDSELIAVALMAAKYFRDTIDHAISFVKCAKTGGPDHLSPAQIDHLAPELIS